jgi:hypothetical protein
MDLIYLSEDIVIKDSLCYYKDKLIKNHNWHHILDELGWSKLHRQWITKLNKCQSAAASIRDSSPYPTNSLFGSLECGGNGDCLFHCIAYSLNSVSDEFYDYNDIRVGIADSITECQFNDIISCYRSMKDIDDFNESWDPYEITTLELFKQQVKEPGNAYWGDHLIIQLLTHVYNINIFILSQNELLHTFEPYLLCQTYDKTYNTILLLHENDSHFKLVGHFMGMMHVNFTDKTLPLEIIRLFNLK